MSLAARTADLTALWRAVLRARAIVRAARPGDETTAAVASYQQARRAWELAS